MLIDVFGTRGFSHLITTPTRGQNILDHLATNRPNLVEHLNITSGLSDHDIINVVSSLSAVVIQHKPCKVYLWNRTNFTKVMSDLIYNIDTPKDNLCNIFKRECETCLNSITTKSLSNSIKHPWVTLSIRNLSNKKKCLYDKVHLSN